MIPDLPGGGGATGVVLAGLPGPQSWWALFKGDWKSFLRLWLDPWGLWWQSVFGGRPKVGPHSATDAVALFLVPSANPILSLWGMGVRLLEAQGIPLSTGNPRGVQLYRQLAAGVRADLVGQFGQDGLTQFEQIAQLVLRCPNPASNRLCIAQRVLHLDNPYLQAVRAGRLDPKTGFKPRCPSGYRFVNGRCVPNAPIVAPTPNCCR